MQNIPMEPYKDPSGSAAFHQHPPYTDDEDDTPGIKKHDVETTFAQNYGLDDIHHVCTSLLAMCIMEECSS